MAILSPEALREAAKRRKSVDIDLDLGTVRLRALSAGAALRFRNEVLRCQKEGGDPEDLAPLVIARSWIGEDGEPLLPEAEGVALALELAPEDYNRLAAAALELNGLTEAAVEVAEKNSEASRNDSTPTGSPENSDTPTSI